MFQLSEISKKNISNSVGLEWDSIVDKDVSTLENHLETRLGKKILSYSKSDDRALTRGSVYLFLNRFLNMNTIDKKLSKI